MFCPLETAMQKSTTIFVLWSISPFMTIVFNSVQFRSVSQSYPTLFDPVDHNTPGLMAINICFMYWGALILGNINIYSCCIFLDWSLDHRLVLFIVSYNCLYLFIYLFFWYGHYYYSFPSISICMEYLFRPFIFSLYMSLDLMLVSCIKHIYGSCFHIHPASLCLGCSIQSIFI